MSDRSENLPGDRPGIALAWVSRGSQADERYVEALRKAGAEPMPLWSDDQAWRERLAEADGVLFTGGGDIDPALYGGRVGHPSLVHLNPERDRREQAVYAFARERELPMLGICRGMQLLNVLYADGGAGADDRGVLLEDVPQAPVRHSAADDGDRSSSYHQVMVVPHTRLAAILGGQGGYPVNSRHHQGLREGDLAGGLIASATSPDGLVEALESPDGRFLVGVQCHPEREGEAPAFVAVIEALVAASRNARGPRSGS